MRTTKLQPASLTVFVAMLLCSQALAHGGGNWHPFTIDRVNQDAYAGVLRVQHMMSNHIRESSDAPVWPAPELRRMRSELLGMKEYVDEILEHFVVEDGISIQLADTRRAQPRAGRTVAALNALNASIAILDRAGEFDDRRAFIQDFHSRGPTSYLFELIEAHLERMALYESLTVFADSDHDHDHDHDH